MIFNLSVSIDEMMDKFRKDDLPEDIVNPDMEQFIIKPDEIDKKTGKILITGKIRFWNYPAILVIGTVLQWYSLLCFSSGENVTAENIPSDIKSLILNIVSYRFELF